MSRPKQTSVSLPTWLHAFAQLRAKALGLSFDQFCAKLLRERVGKVGAL